MPFPVLRSYAAATSFLLSIATTARSQYTNGTTAASVPPPSGISYPNPTGVSTSYATKSYNASAASTYLVQTDFSDERLALLWDQVGPIATGPVTTTVSPTPEPSKFASPGVFHPYIPSYEPGLNNVTLPANFIWGVASSAFQVEVSRSHQTHQSEC